ncbi:hypothetical protein [Roseivivax sp.]
MPLSSLTRALAALALAVCAAGPAPAQEAGAPDPTFASENAILDTSILFAIGAREARQELRGAFGWPTFQEGLVEGVYFRFDPDGYARFAPSPRLDADVFEVICRPRTYTCMGRKGAMQVALTPAGQLQLDIENASEGDDFVLAENIDELALPKTLLQPLDRRLEALLSSGGELVIRRNGAEVARISLSGFYAATTYLRWVAARQDYAVLPRGWPVPNSVQDGPGALTRTEAWASPMPRPLTAPGAPAQAPAPALPGTAQPPRMAEDVAEVRGELRILREMMMGQPVVPAPGAGAPLPPAAPQAPGAMAERLTALEAQAEALLSEIAHLRGVMAPAAHGAPQAALAPQSLSPAPAALGSGPGSEAERISRQLDYLMTEIGLAPDVALTVIQHQRLEADPEAQASRAAEDALIDSILAEIGPAPAPPQPPAPEIPPEDYQLLSDYVRSVMEEIDR